MNPGNPCVILTRNFAGVGKSSDAILPTPRVHAIPIFGPTTVVVQSDWSVGSSADVVAVIATLAAMTTGLITTCLSTDKEIPSQC